jgi:hypothetical protein
MRKVREPSPAVSFVVRRRREAATGIAENIGFVVRGGTFNALRTRRDGTSES